jgi:ABC-type Fe3+/spermidine/putrescine transport system ATPase subunit
MLLVSFRDVQKSYRSLQGAEYVAVKHFSLDIEAAEFFCLLGPGGCGKTTVSFAKTSAGGKSLICRR